MPSEVTICVFAKPPRAGLVKTRLAAAIGNVPAAELAAAFLADTWMTVSQLQWASPVLACTEPAVLDGFSSTCELWLQGASTLGEKLERLLQRAIMRSGRAIAIGADTPGLPSRALEDAAHLLRTRDAVLGPCEDGGFYLLGLRRCPPGLLDRLPWSSPRTLDATVERLWQFGLTVELIDPWFDVDTAADLRRLTGLIQRKRIVAPSTARTLQRLGLATPAAERC